MQPDDFYGGLPDPDEMRAPVAEVEPRRRCEPGEHIEPVRLEIVRRCEFKRKPCGLCGKPKTNKVHHKRDGTCPYKRQLGCARCNAAMNDPAHLGAPESFNLFASGSWEAYQGAKQRWHKVLGPMLVESGLPLGLDFVLVEGECSFGDVRDRDQGNHRVVIEKAVGDVLEEMGYVENDSWGHYEFGRLARVEEEGVNRLRLMIFARAPRLPEVPAQTALL